jgi:hypothetical protein
MWKKSKSGQQQKGPEGKKAKRTEESAELRFKDTVPLQKFRRRTIGIAGLGATGKQVATILSVMGHKSVWGADPDKVELKNIGTQGWGPEDVGEYKAVVLQNSLRSRRSLFLGALSRFELMFSPPELTKGYQKTNVFFCCVDTMQARTAIWTELGRKGLLQGQKIWIESRIASRVIRIITIPLNDGAMKEYYESTLYGDSEAFQGSCTDRMTYYGAGIAAGLMVSQLVNWLNMGAVPASDFVLETVTMGAERIK